MTDFYDMFGALPRQTVGSDASTHAALALVRDHLPRHRPVAVADFGCGTGRASLVLAHELGRDLDGAVTALDIRPRCLERLRAEANRRGLGDRIHPLCADLGAVPLAPASLDLIWCEGAVFVLGAERACRQWAPLLRPGGWLVFSDMVWGPAPDDATTAFMAELGVTLPTRDGLHAAARAAGLKPRHAFTLPEADWWEEYYRPLAELLETCPPSPQRDATWREIELRWQQPTATEYVFVLAQRAG